MKEVNRRKFMKQSAVLTSTAMVTLPGITSATISKYKMGLQLFSQTETASGRWCGERAQVREIAVDAPRPLDILGPQWGENR